MKQITIKNIKDYIEGNAKMFLKDLQPEHIKQQISYRMLICSKDCMITKECKYCGCSVPGKLYNVISCNNGKRFPDLMSKSEWDKFKIENGIK